jgi:hypothetical protein
MSAIKAFAEEVSVELGFGGKLNEDVLAEAQRRLLALGQEDDKLTQCQKAARSFREASAAYKKAFDRYSASVELLPQEQFWELAGRLLVLFKRECNVEKSVDELFRTLLAADMLEQGIRFAKTWRQLSSDLYKPLFNVSESRGDDAYSDWLDAFPLLGKEIYGKALRGEYTEELEIRCDAEGRLKPMLTDHDRVWHVLQKAIFYDENYFWMTLKDTGWKYFANHC